jgi:hypothetical protein
MTSPNEHDYRGMFFTGKENDKRGDYYSSLCMASPYNAAINAEDDTNKRCLVGLMLAGDYYVKQPDMRDEDIHNEFVDFIVETAMWHRTIDRSTEAYLGLETVRKVIDAYIRIMDGGYKNIVFNGKTFQDFMIVGAEEKNYVMMQPDLNVNVYESLGFNSNFAKKVITEIKSDIPVIRGMLLGLMTVAYAYNTYDEYLQGLRGMGDNFSANAVVNASQILAEVILENTYMDGNYLRMNAETVAPITVLDVMDPDYEKTPSQHLATRLTAIDIQELYGHVANKIKEFFDNWVNLFINKYKQHKLPETDAKYGDMEAKWYTTHVQGFIYALNEAVQAGVVQYVKQKAAGRYVNLSDPNAFRFHEYMVENYNKMHPDTRNFYAKNIKLFKRTNGEWHEVTNPCDAKVDDRSKFRYNLSKIAGERYPKFGDTIPLVKPGYNAKQFWYTDVNGNVRKILIKNGVGNDVKDHKFLQQLYKDVYYYGPGLLSFTINNETYTLNLPRDASKYDKTFFNIHSEKLFARQLNEQTRARQLAQKHVSEGNYQLIDENWNRWSWNKNTDDYTSRALDGSTPKIVNLDVKSLIPTDNCESTFLSGDANTCSQYISKCLLGNDKDSLEVCLDFLQRKDFVNIADSIIENIHKRMHPKIALETLRKLKFRVISHYDSRAKCELKFIESVESWIDKLREDTKGKNVDINGIINNTGFKRYLGQLILLVNNNPGLLNADFANKYAPGIAPPITGFVKDLKIKRHYTPKVKMFVSPFRQVIQTPISPMLARLQSGRYAPVYGTGGINAFPFSASSGMHLMYGGNQSGSGLFHNEKCGAGLAKRFYNQIKEDLKLKNKSISTKSDQTIQTLLNNFEICETNIGNSLAQLEQYIKLTDANKDYSIKEVTLPEVERLIGEHEKLENKYIGFNRKIIKAFDTLLEITSQYEMPMPKSYAEPQKYESLSNYYP